MRLLPVYCYSSVLIGLVSLVPCHLAAPHQPPMKDYIDGTETWQEEDRHKNDPFFMDLPEIRKKITWNDIRSAFGVPSRSAVSGFSGNSALNAFGLDSDHFWNGQPIDMSAPIEPHLRSFDSEEVEEWESRPMHYRRSPQDGWYSARG
ncbi:hypothetical protein DdX_17111 [Ditylenchus destructor]|uniref:Uncharacterized protein n=1 Tax=Ditylenchus destructor TaxID=166010 RepID=A0AAD4MSE8_9BILA|nr:hypothetical protein DdX_17111 [Ditylenchus destructor]